MQRITDAFVSNPSLWRRAGQSPSTVVETVTTDRGRGGGDGVAARVDQLERLVWLECGIRSIDRGPRELHGRQVRERGEARPRWSALGWRLFDPLGRAFVGGVGDRLGEPLSVGGVVQRDGPHARYDLAD